MQMRQVQEVPALASATEKQWLSTEATLSQKHRFLLKDVYIRPDIMRLTEEFPEAAAVGSRQQRISVVTSSGS